MCSIIRSMAQVNRHGLVLARGVWMKPRRNMKRFILPRPHSTQPGANSQDCGNSELSSVNGRDKPSLPRFQFLEDPPFFTDYPLDRAASSRPDRDLMFELLKSPNAKVIFFHRGLCLFYPWKKARTGTESQEDLTANRQVPTSKPVILQSLRNYEDMIDPKVGTVFLGFEKGPKKTPVFSAVIKQDLHKTLKEEDEDWEWKNVLSEGPRMSKVDGALMSAVNGMMEFHLKNLKCGKTGQSTAPVNGGHGRVHKSVEGLAKTPNNLKPHIVFPRVDPAVIVLVRSGDYCLLGRKSRWAHRRYSLLAGFAELGESLEQACVREILEESNVKVDPKTIKYEGSQPWPFPQSLMIGFRCSIEDLPVKERTQSFPYTLSGNVKPEGSGLDRLAANARNAALETGITPDELDEYLSLCLPACRPDATELADVRWFHTDYLMTKVQDASGSVSLPGQYSLARRILETWFADFYSRKVHWAGDAIPDVQIDTGKFKYVLLRVYDSDGNSKLVVRGSRGASYHMDVKTSFATSCEGTGLEVNPLGGGRIEHDNQKGRIVIYGYSSAFGTAVHEVAGVLCQRWFPDYDYRMIKVAYEGY